MDEIQIIQEHNQIPLKPEEKDIVSKFLAQHDVMDISKAKYKQFLHHFFKWVTEKGVDLKTATKTNAVDYKQSLIKEGKSPSTVMVYVVACRVLYNWLESQHRIPNIFKDVKSPSDSEDMIKQHLSNEKAKELLQFFNNSQSLRNFAIVSLMLRTGIRTIEVCRIRIKDLEFFKERWRIMIHGKGRIGRSEFVMLEDKAKQPIDVYLLSRKDEKLGNYPLFANESQNCGVEDGLTTKTISDICRKGLNEIGLTGRLYTAHSLRTTYACTLIENGANLEDVQAALRHKDIATTQRYLRSINMQERIKRRVESLINNSY